MRQVHPTYKWSCLDLQLVLYSTLGVLRTVHVVLLFYVVALCSLFLSFSGRKVWIHLCHVPAFWPFFLSLSNLPHLTHSLTCRLSISLSLLLLLFLPWTDFSDMLCPLSNYEYRVSSCESDVSNSGYVSFHRRNVASDCTRLRGKISSSTPPCGTRTFPRRGWDSPTTSYFRGRGYVSHIFCAFSHLCLAICLTRVWNCQSWLFIS